MDGTQNFAGGGMTVTVHARSLGEGYRGLDRADLFVLYMVHDAFPERPLFFSRTDGDYPEELGFADHIVDVGLARKLVQKVPAPSDSLVRIAGAKLLDVATTYALWTQSFDGIKSLSAKQRWLDKPSMGIPFMYVRTGYELAQALQEKGRTADASKVMAQVAAVAKGAQLTDMIRGGRLQQ